MAQQDNQLAVALSQSRGRTWTRNHLCSICKNIVASSTAATSPQHQTASEIKKSAYEGCHMCSLLHGSFFLVPREDCQPSSIASVDGPWVAHVSFNEGGSGNQMTVECYSAGRRNDSLILTLFGSLPEARALDSEADNTPVEVKDNTGSLETLVIAKSWLEECLDNHSGVCIPHHRELPRIVPTRLIEIDGSAASLSLSKAHNPNVQYLILSYCWGKEQPDELKLQKTNEASFHQSIPFGDLPRTVADTVVVTWKLGYRYLWVDRLCIVQDDYEDWKREASRMGEYYTNSDCCIAAEWSDDSHKGLFTHRNPLILQPLQVTGPQPDQTRVISAKQIGNARGHYPQLYRGPFYPLSKRAWVVQERLLSPRTLYFGSIMIYWECRKMRRAEQHPCEELDLPWPSNLRKLGSRSSASISTTDRMDFISENAAGEEDLWHAPYTKFEKDGFQERWADLVEHYTACGMTYPEKDRLMAISGIISSIATRTREKFVHGLLESRLASELLWWQWTDCNGDNEIAPVRTGPLVTAPTWSWGSVVGRIQPCYCRRFLGISRRDGWEVEIRASVEKEPPLPLLGNVDQSCKNQSCRIDFQAPIAEAYVESRIDLRHYCWSVGAVINTGDESFLKFDAQFWPDEPVEEGMAVWLLRCTISEATESQPITYHAGLVIVPIGDGWNSGNGKTYWKRIGYWQTFADVVPIEISSVSKKQREAAWRMAINVMHKHLYLI